MDDHVVQVVVYKIFQAVGVALDTMIAASLSEDPETSLRASAGILEFALDFLHLFDGKEEEEEAEDVAGTER